MESFIILYFSTFQLEINCKYIVHLSPWPGLQRSPPFFCRSIVCVFPHHSRTHREDNLRILALSHSLSLSHGALTNIFSQLRSQVSGGKIDSKHPPGSHLSQPTVLKSNLNIKIFCLDISKRILC